MVHSEEAMMREMLFLHTVAMFQAAAMQQLGKLPDPAGGEIAKDLAQAKITIDILDVLKEKTKGNLSKTESEFLDKVLFELHMNYVDELKSSKTTDAESGKGSTGEIEK
jgi:hypothetical protein